jgi:isopropylmalate/homocitrate/citramalate synthase
MSGNRVEIVEVGPRDGLQNEKTLLPTEAKVELVRRALRAGIRRVEVTSFVHPRLVPQMAGAEDVVAALPAAADVVWSGLVLNRRGLERALETGLREVHAAYPVTPGFARANQNTTPEAAAAETAVIIAAAHGAGLRATVTLSCCFGCPFDGVVDPALVAEHVGRSAAAGADEILLADTIGAGTPRQATRLVRDALGAAPGIPVGLHLHNTRNTGYANAYAGLEAGATVLDASIGGLGGCPFAPRATGNIATEDLVYLLDGLGIDHGCDLDELIRVSEWLEGVLGHELPGLLHRAGGFPG